MRIITILTLLFLGSSFWAQPLNYEHLEASEEDGPTEDRAAGCAPASASTFLEFNNVKALIHTGGNLWQIAGQNFSQYEVPKGSGIMALFTSALWLGGVNGPVQ